MFETGFDSVIVPGWHTTIFPFYYIAGFLLSYFSLILFFSCLFIKFSKVEKTSYQTGLNWANLILCVLSSVVIICYLKELIMSFVSGGLYESMEFLNRILGLYFIGYMLLMWVPLLLTQLFWRKKHRLNLNLTLFICFVLNIGFWLERLSIIITTLLRG